jgi:hypothetical protein
MTLLLATLMLLAQVTAPPPVTPAPVLPEDTKPVYRAHSPPTCGDWRAAREGTVQDSRARFQIYKRWVLGYISGFNAVGPDPTGNLLGDTEPEIVYAAIEGYCERNPSYLVVDAMHPIADALIRRRETGPLPPIAPDRRRTAIFHAVTSCVDWTKDRGDPLIRLAHLTVLRGYLTAYNRYSSDPAGDAIGADDGAPLEQAVDTWCDANPSSLVIGAISPLIDHVAAERAAGRLPPGGMRPGETFSPASSAEP